jgi:hypothetical protein
VGWLIMAALVGFPALGMASIHDRGLRVVLLVSTCIFYRFFWNRVFKGDRFTSTLFFWTCLIAFLLLSAQLRWSNEHGASTGECLDTGRYGEYVAC